MNSERFLAQAADTTVLVVGDVMVDAYLWGRVDRISPEAPVPIFMQDRMEHRPGVAPHGRDAADHLPAAAALQHPARAGAQDASAARTGLARRRSARPHASMRAGALPDVPPRPSARIAAGDHPLDQ